MVKNFRNGEVGWQPCTMVSKTPFPVRSRLATMHDGVKNTIPGTHRRYESFDHSLSITFKLFSSHTQ